MRHQRRGLVPRRSKKSGRVPDEDGRWGTERGGPGMELRAADSKVRWETSESKGVVEYKLITSLKHFADIVCIQW